MNNINNFNKLLFNKSKNFFAGSLPSPSSLVSSSSFITDFGDYLSANLDNAPINKANHLIKSFHIVMENLLQVHPYYSSFLNSTSLTSSKANDVFLADLIKNVDESLKNVSYSQISSDFFGANYQSFTHSDSNNYLQDAIISITTSLNSSSINNSFVVTKLKNSFSDLLSSYGLPMNSIKLHTVLKGMSVLLASQMGNLGHLVNTNA